MMASNCTESYGTKQYLSSPSGSISIGDYSTHLMEYYQLSAIKYHFQEVLVIALRPTSAE
jgi:hypothetical protein